MCGLRRLVPPCGVRRSLFALGRISSRYRWIGAAHAVVRGGGRPSLHQVGIPMPLSIFLFPLHLSLPFGRAKARDGIRRRGQASALPGRQAGDPTGPAPATTGGGLREVRLLGLDFLRRIGSAFRPELSKKRAPGLL